MISILQSIKYLSLEFVASSSQRQELLEEKLVSIVATQEVTTSKKWEMDNQMKTVITR